MIERVPVSVAISLSLIGNSLVIGIRASSGGSLVS